VREQRLHSAAAAFAVPQERLAPLAALLDGGADAVLSRAPARDGTHVAAAGLSPSCSTLMRMLNNIVSRWVPFEPWYVRIGFDHVSLRMLHDD
jgi:hypothetical protein